MTSGRVVIYTLVLILVELLLNDIDALSVCDETDVAMIVDMASLQNHHAEIKRFITKIIDHGSSEYSAFSIVLYGDVPIKYKDGLVVTFEETVNVKSRKEEEKKIVDALEDIKKAMGDKTAGTQKIDLLKAFNTAQNGQKTPDSPHKKQTEFANYKKNLGKYDGQKAYFIFDHNGNLIKPSKEFEEEKDKQKPKNSNDVLCELFAKRKKGKKEEESAETLHFMIGQQLPELLTVYCEEKEPLIQAIKTNAFYHFDVAKLEKEDKMKEIYSITCPAIVDIPAEDDGEGAVDEHGIIDLGSNAQWIVPNTVIKCDMEWWDHDEDATTPDVLTEESEVTIKDYLDDGNTFGVGEYLLFNKDLYSKQEIGCSSPVFKLTKEIGKGRIGKDKESGKSFTKRRFKIKLPDNPTEYIDSANVKGKRALSTWKRVKHKFHAVHAMLAAGNKRSSLFRKRIRPKPSPLTALARKSQSQQSALLSQRRRLIGKKISLINFHKKGEAKFERKGKLEASKKITAGAWNPELKINGDGSIELSVGYELKAKIDLEFVFEWSIIKKTLKVELKIVGEVSLTTKFNAVLAGELKMAINKLVNFGHTFVLYVVTVPIVIKWYVLLDAELKILPLKIKGGIECEYKQPILVGYRVERERDFTPQYSLIKNDTTFDLWILETFKKVKKEDECAQKVYEFGIGGGHICKWFSYNEKEQKCRCHRPARVRLDEDIKQRDGWKAYILNHKLEEEYSRNGQKCDDGDLILSKSSGNYQCQKSVYEKTEATYKTKKGPIKVKKDDDKEKEDDDEEMKKKTTSICNPILEINGKNMLEPEACPVLEFGFDVTITPKIGLVFYYLIDLFASVDVIFPFRITIPEMDAKICDTNLTKQDTCNEKKADSLMASPTIEGKCNVNLGVKVHLDKIINFIGDLIGAPSVDDKLFEKKIKIYTKTFMEKRKIGDCKPLSAITASKLINKPKIEGDLDKYFRNHCCKKEDTKKKKGDGKAEFYDMLYYDEDIDDEYNIYDNYDDMQYVTPIEPLIVTSSWLLSLIFIVIVCGVCGFIIGCMLGEANHNKQEISKFCKKLIM